jgi:hypothetical protein
LPPPLRRLLQRPLLLSQALYLPRLPQLRQFSRQLPLNRAQDLRHRPTRPSSRLPSQLASLDRNQMMLLSKRRHQVAFH